MAQSVIQFRSYTVFTSYLLLPYLPAGCGSVLNVKGEVEMDAIVMDGSTLASGAVSAVRNIANPIQLARLVMEKVQSCPVQSCLVL